MDAFAAQSANAAGCAEAVPMQFQHKNANFSAEHPPEPKTAKKLLPRNGNQDMRSFLLLYTTLIHPLLNVDNEISMGINPIEIIFSG